MSSRPAPSPIKPGPHTNGHIHPVRSSGLSVIICAFNSAQRLPATLAALRAQTPLAAGWEIIVVDNASTDETAQVCRDAWVGSQVPMRIVPESKAGLSYARHAGVRASQREMFCFVDDDNHLDPDYLTIADEILKANPKVGVLGGQGIALTDDPLPPWLWQGWQSHAVGPQGKVEGYVDPSRGFVYGAGMIVRRSAWDELVATGFASLLTDREGVSLSSGGDVELCLALQLLDWKIYFSPRLKFGHLMPAGRLTWDYCQRLFTAYGEANAVLELYQPWLARGTKAALKRTLPGALLYEMMELRRLKVRLKQSPPSEVGSLAALSSREALGKKNAIWRHFRTGRFLSVHREISNLAKRAKILRASGTS